MADGEDERDPGPRDLRDEYRHEMSELASDSAVSARRVRLWLDGQMRLVETTFIRLAQAAQQGALEAPGRDEPFQVPEGWTMDQVAEYNARFHDRQRRGLPLETGVMARAEDREEGAQPTTPATTAALHVEPRVVVLSGLDVAESTSDEEAATGDHDGASPAESLFSPASHRPLVAGRKASVPLRAVALVVSPRPSTSVPVPGRHVSFPSPATGSYYVASPTLGTPPQHALTEEELFALGVRPEASLIATPPQRKRRRSPSPPSHPSPGIVMMESTTAETISWEEAAEGGDIPKEAKERELAPSGRGWVVGNDDNLRYWPTQRMKGTTTNISHPVRRNWIEEGVVDFFECRSRCLEIGEYPNYCGSRQASIGHHNDMLGIRKKRVVSPGGTHRLKHPDQPAPLYTRRSKLEDEDPAMKALFPPENFTSLIDFDKYKEEEEKKKEREAAAQTPAVVATPPLPSVSTEGDEAGEAQPEAEEESAAADPVPDNESE